MDPHKTAATLSSTGIAFSFVAGDALSFVAGDTHSFVAGDVLSFAAGDVLSSTHVTLSLVSATFTALSRTPLTLCSCCGRSHTTASPPCVASLHLPQALVLEPALPCLPVLLASLSLEVDAALGCLPLLRWMRQEAACLHGASTHTLPKQTRAQVVTIINRLGGGWLSAWDKPARGLGLGLKTGTGTQGWDRDSSSGG